MIAIAIAVILSGMFGLLAYDFNRTGSPMARLVCLMLAGLALIAGLLAAPYASSMVAEQQRQQELARAEAMTRALGSAALYVEYLKATQAD